jgi:hypothetical protein
MLSAAVAHGVLSIEGTSRSDTIVLTMDSPRTLRVRVGDTESTFLKKTFGKIRITAGRGEDLVTIGSDTSPITCPVSVSGGDGSDTIIGGAGNDKLDGGAGADQIAGGAGDDSVTGDNGNDDLHGGDGRDSLSGGKGDDELHDDAGRDAVLGNAGVDLVYFHDDVQQFRDLANAEKSYAEPQFQISKPADSKLVMNKCPLYAKDGTQFSGGLVKAGGSTLVMSGNVLEQWAGEGLASSNATVPHFDLPGGSYSGAGSGTVRFDSGSSGSITINGVVGINTGIGVPGWWISDGATLSVEAGSVITAADSSTRTVQSGETLTVVGPSTITMPEGVTPSVVPIKDGITVTVTGRAIISFLETADLTFTGPSNVLSVPSLPGESLMLTAGSFTYGEWSVDYGYDAATLLVQSGTRIKLANGTEVTAAQGQSTTLSYGELNYPDGHLLHITGSWTVTITCPPTSPIDPA